MKSVIIRSISGIVYIALIVASLLAGQWYFTALCALFAVLGVIEFTKLFQQRPVGTLLLVDCLAAIAIVAAPLGLSMFLAAGASGVPDGLNSELHTGITILICTLTFIPAAFIIRLVTSLFDLRPNAFMSVVQSLAAVSYLGLPLCCLNLLYANAGWQLVLIMFVMIWINDTGAFCFGSRLGKHKMSPRLSPKKSWEGLIGGFACAIGVGIATYFCFNPWNFSIIGWILLGLLVGVFATWGDLFESLMKRSIGVKDSGHLIPGHGGILDRIDSLLLVAPFTLLFYVFATLIG